jgi:hypothetical protein
MMMPHGKGFKSELPTEVGLREVEEEESAENTKGMYTGGMNVGGCKKGTISPSRFRNTSGSEFRRCSWFIMTPVHFMRKSYSKTSIVTNDMISELLSY